MGSNANGDTGVITRLGDVAIGIIMRYGNHDRGCSAYVSKYDSLLSPKPRGDRKCTCGFVDARAKLQKAIDNDD